LPGVGGEGKKDVARWIGGETLTAEQGVGGGDGGGFFVENGEAGAGSGLDREHGEAAFADEGAAGFTATDEFDDPDAAFAGEFGEFEGAAGALEGWVVIVGGGLVVGDKAVEIEIGIDLAAGGAVDVLGVDLVNFDEEAGDVFEVEVEGDFVPGEPGFAGGGVEFEVRAGAEFRQGSRREQGGELVSGGGRGGELGFGEEGVEEPSFEVGLIGCGVGVFGEENQQGAADEGGVVGDRT
jgi:hypothetical protein